VGTDAVFPVELAHTAVGAVIVASGSGLIATVLLLLEAQPALDVTVTFKFSEAPVPAVNETLGPVVLVVIVPPVIVQA